MIADAINQQGGELGALKQRTNANSNGVWTAYDVQQFRWAMMKTENPRVSNRDFSSYDEVVTGLKGFRTTLSRASSRRP